MIDYRPLLQKYNITPQKSKGQNFLVDEDVVETIINEAALNEKDRILEVGPGLGVLTEELILHAGKVLSVELDEQLAIIAADRFKEHDNFELLRADILDVKNAELQERLGGETYRVIANIPYVITSAIIRKFLSYDPKPKDMILMVQKEVAERITAEPGSMSVLAISVQFYAQARIVVVVPKDSFYPAPEVDSAIIHIILDTEPRHDVDEKKFFGVVKMGFSARRKKLYNNLAAGTQKEVDEIKLILEQSGIAKDARAQDLSVDDWVKLCANI